MQRHKRNNKPTMLVACNEKGYRIGESHHNATLSDADVRAIEIALEDADQAHEAGRPFPPDAEIARRHGVAKSTVHAIRYGLRRCQIPTTYRRVKTKVL